MITLNPTVVFATQQNNSNLNINVPNDWLTQLARQCAALLKEAPDKLIQSFNRHFGSHSTYALKESMIASLQDIYCRMSLTNKQALANDTKLVIAVKLDEAVAQCPEGAHIRIINIQRGFYVPQTLGEHCLKIRTSKVEKVASQLTDEVHASNQVYIAARGLGYGVHPMNENDPYRGALSDEDIEAALKSVFNQEYTPASLPNQIIESIRNTLLHSFGYTGKLENGYEFSRYEAFSNYLSLILEEKCGPDYFITNEKEAVIDINWNKVKHSLCQLLIKKNYFNINKDDKSFALIIQLLSNNDDKQNSNLALDTLFIENWIQSSSDLVNTLKLFKGILPDRRMELIQLAFQRNKNQEERAEWLQEILKHLHPDHSITSPCASHYLQYYHQDLPREKWPQALFTELAKKSVEEQCQILGYSQSALIYATKYLSTADMSSFLDHLYEINEQTFLKDVGNFTKIFLEKSDNVVLLCRWLAQKNSNKTPLDYLHKIIPADQLESIIKERADRAIALIPVLSEEMTKKIWFGTLKNITEKDADSKLKSILSIVNAWPLADKIKFFRMTDEDGNNTLLAVIRLLNNIKWRYDYIDFSKVESVSFILEIVSKFPYRDQVAILKQVGTNKTNALLAYRTRYFSENTPSVIAKSLNQLDIKDQLDIWLTQGTSKECTFYSAYFKDNPIRRLQSYDLDTQKELLANLFSKIDFHIFIWESKFEYKNDLMELVKTPDLKLYFLTLMNIQENNLLELFNKNPYTAAVILPLLSDDQIKKIILTDNFLVNLAATAGYQTRAWWLMHTVLSHTVNWSETERYALLTQVESQTGRNLLEIILTKKSKYEFFGSSDLILKKISPANKLYEILNHTDFEGNHPLLLAIVKADTPDKDKDRFGSYSIFTLEPYLGLPLEPEQYVQLWLKENNKNNNALLTALWFDKSHTEEAAEQSLVNAVECFVTQLCKLSIEKQEIYLLQLLPKIEQLLSSKIENYSRDDLSRKRAKSLHHFILNCSPLLLTKLKEKRVITDRFITFANSDIYKSWTTSFFHLLSDNQCKEIFLTNPPKISISSFINQYSQTASEVAQALINWVFKQKMYEQFSHEQLANWLDDLTYAGQPEFLENLLSYIDTKETKVKEKIFGFKNKPINPLSMAILCKNDKSRDVWLKQVEALPLNTQLNYWFDNEKNSSSRFEQVQHDPELIFIALTTISKLTEISAQTIYMYRIVNRLAQDELRTLLCNIKRVDPNLQIKLWLQKNSKNKSALQHLLESENLNLNNQILNVKLALKEFCAALIKVYAANKEAAFQYLDEIVQSISIDKLLKHLQLVPSSPEDYINFLKLLVEKKIKLNPKLLEFEPLGKYLQNLAARDSNKALEEFELILQTGVFDESDKIQFGTYLIVQAEKYLGYRLNSSENKVDPAMLPIIFRLLNLMEKESQTAILSNKPLFNAILASASHRVEVFKLIAALELKQQYDVLNNNEFNGFGGALKYCEKFCPDAVPKVQEVWNNLPNEETQKKCMPYERFSQFRMWTKTPPQKLTLYETKIAQHLEKIHQKLELFGMRDDRSLQDSPYQSLKRLNAQLTKTFNQYKRSAKTLDDALMLESNFKAALDVQGVFSKELAVLGEHRGWKDFFIKLLLCVTVIGGIYLAISRKTKFTKTDTEQETEELGKTIASSPFSYGNS